MQLAGKRILIDPVLSSYAAPFSFLNKAFAGEYPWRAESMPEIDLLIISHDHYDHLDYATIKALLPKVKRVVTPLGVGSHLRYWGMTPEIIDERDWNQSVHISDALTVHVLPARHFSGRGIKRNQTLWGELYVCHPRAKGLLQRRLRLRPALQGYWRAVWRSGLSHYGKRAVRPRTGSTSICIRRKRRRPRQISMPGAVVPGHNGRFVLAKHTSERSTDPAGESQQG